MTELHSKEELERLKIKAEIDEINKSIFKKKELYIALLPVLLGIIGLVFSWRSGYFDVKLGMIDVKTGKLEIKVQELKRDSANLYKQYTIDSLKNVEAGEEQVFLLDSVYQAKNDSLILDNQKFHDSISLAKKKDEEILKKLRSDANLKNSENSDLIARLSTLEATNKIIIPNLEQQIQKLENEINIEKNSYSDEEIQKLKFKLIAFFKFNRQYYSMPLEQLQKFLGKEYTENVVERLVSDNPSIFRAAKFKPGGKYGLEGIGIQKDLNWKDINN